MWRDIIDNWLSRFEPSAALDQSGAVGLVLAGGTTMTMHVSETGLLRVFMDLLRLPTDAARMAVLEAALASNLAGGETGGASIGLNPARDTLVLALARDLDGFALDALEPLLAAFATAGQDLRQRLSALRAAAPVNPTFAHVDPSLLA